MKTIVYNCRKCRNIMTEIKKLTADDLNLVTGGKKPEEKGNKKVGR